MIPSLGTCRTSARHPQPADKLVDLVPGKALVRRDVKVLADGAGMPEQSDQALAKSPLWVKVQMLVPSPGTMILAPRRIRSMIVNGFSQLPTTTGIWEGP